MLVIFIENKHINMNKKLIRLTESDLHRIVRESVNKILKEDGYLYNGIEYQNHVMMSEKQVDNEMKFKKHAVSYHILDNQHITVKVIDYRGRSKESFKWRTPYSEGNRGWWDIFYNL